MSDEEYEFGSDGGDEFVIEAGSDEDEDDGDDGEEGGLEDQYYTAKDMIGEDDEQSFKLFKALLEADGGSSKFTYKALKKLVLLTCRLQQHSEMLQYFSQLIEFRWSGHSRTILEKAIHKGLESITECPPDVQNAAMEKALEGISGGQYENLAFQIRLKLAHCAFERKDFPVLQGMIGELVKWAKGADGQLDPMKATQYVVIKSLEIQMKTEQGDCEALGSLYSECLNVESAIPPPKILGVIHECGGKMYMRQGRYQSAATAFFDAFKSYDEAAHPRRIDCLKYLVLATVLSNSDIDPFDSSEAKPYKNDPQIKEMTRLIEAYKDADIVETERLSKKKAIGDDDFMPTYIAPLLRTVRKKVCMGLTKPYTMVKVEYLAGILKQERGETERLLADMILDRQISGKIDQVRGLLLMRKARKESGENMQQWSKNLLSLHHQVLHRHDNISFSY